MHAYAVVEHLDIFEGRGTCGVAAFKGIVVCQFELERGEETLCYGVVVRHARPAHAQPDIGCLRIRPITSAGVLAAAIVTEDQPRLGAPMLQGQVERALCQIQALVIIHCPADDAPTAGIDERAGSSTFAVSS